MPTLRIDEVTENPGDVLLVFAALIPDDPDAAPQPLVARGWSSARTNHFGPECYDPLTGHRMDDATPRRMTQEEEADYYRRLFAEQHGVGG